MNSNKELIEALSFYSPPPKKKISGTILSTRFPLAVHFRYEPLDLTIEEVGLWFFEVIKGDFAEDPSAMQIVSGAAISLIPLVDQMCDIRDLVANINFIADEVETSGKPEVLTCIALGLTLIGAFPELGSLIKGCCKLLLRPLKKIGLPLVQAFKNPKEMRVLLEKSEVVNNALNNTVEFLKNGKIQKYLKEHKILDVVEFIHESLKKIKDNISVQTFKDVYTKIAKECKTQIEMIMPYLSAKQQTQALELLHKLDHYREIIFKQFEELIEGFKEVLVYFAEHFNPKKPNTHIGNVDNVNPHATGANLPDGGKKPTGKTGKLFDNSKLRLPVDEKFAPKPKAGWPELGDKYNTFSGKITADVLQNDVSKKMVLYRVIDHGDTAKGRYWMTEDVFNSFKTKQDWRQGAAVKESWNKNGKVARYELQPGEEINVWRGKAASQHLDEKVKLNMQGSYSTDEILAGGAEQIFADARKFKGEMTISETNWPDHVGGGLSGVGLPTTLNDKAR